MVTGTCNQGMMSTAAGWLGSGELDYSPIQTTGALVDTRNQSVVDMADLREELSRTICAGGVVGKMWDERWRALPLMLPAGRWPPPSPLPFPAGASAAGVLTGQ